MPTIRLVCQDCKEALTGIEPGGVHAIITDPPYGTLDGRGKVTKRGNALTDFAAGEWDRALPLAWVSLAMKLLVDGGWYVVFTDKLSVKEVWQAFERHGGHGKQTFHWIKPNPPPQPRRNFASGVESAIVGTKGPVSIWNGGGWRPNHFTAPIVGRSERVGHPTQKPLSLMRYLVESVTLPGMTVLDPFMGSGSTGVACAQLGRGFIGIEIDETWFDIAGKRIDSERQRYRLPLEVEQTDLFGM